MFTELIRDKEIPNDILRMFEVGIGIALSVPYDDEFTTTEEVITDKRVTTILHDDTIREDRREAFTQQTKLGWTRIFTGYISTKWRRSTSEFYSTNGPVHASASSSNGKEPAGLTRTRLYTAHQQNNINNAVNNYRQKHEYGLTCRAQNR